MALKTYDPTRVHAVFGVIPLEGFVDGTGIRVVRAEPTYNALTGINGVVVRTRNLNKSGQITISLAQTSLSNTLLSLVAIGDEITGAGTLPFIIFDTGSLSAVVSAHAWIRRVPDVEYSKGISVREWVFDCADIDILANGTFSDSSS